jgi:hypothetical protein
VSNSARPARSLAPYSTQVVYSEPGAVTELMLRNVLILVWDQQPTAAVIARLEDAGEHVRQHAARGTSMIHVVRGPLLLPNDAERSAMVRMMKSHNVRLVAMVVTQTGFILSMLRSVVTGLRVLTGGHFDYRICQSHEEVADWLPEAHAARTGVEIEKAHLLRALGEATTPVRGL